MPRPIKSKTKRSAAQTEQLTLVRHGQPLQAADLVSLTPKELQPSQPELLSVTEKLVQTQGLLQIAEDKAVDLYGTIRVVKRKLQRTTVRKTKLETQIALLQSVELPAAKGDAVKAIQLFDKSQLENAGLKCKLSHMMEKCAVEAGQAIVTHSELKAALAESKRKNIALKKCCDRGIDATAKAVKRAKQNSDKENRTFRLLSKGTYKPQARELARMLVAAGCSKEYVGSVIQMICKKAGVTVQGKMSRRTVSRAILEGGIAAEIQLGHELTQAKGENSVV
jgi:hypothetical protein